MELLGGLINTLMIVINNKAEGKLRKCAIS